MLERPCPSNPVLVMPRRNFLVRALGFTAAGATIAVPIVTMEAPEKRFRHHIDQAMAAMNEMFPGQHVQLKGNCLDGHHAAYVDMLARGEQTWACAILMAGPRVEGDT